MGLSDHSSVKFKLCYSYVEPTYTYRRQFHRCDYNLVCRFLSSISWRDSFDSVPSVNEKYEILIKALSLAVDMFVPWGRVEARQAHLPLYLLNMLDHRDYLFRAANDTHGVNEWVKFNNSVKKSIKHCKSSIVMLRRRCLSPGVVVSSIDT